MIKIRHQTKVYIESRLLRWFAKNKREMPWRSKKSAYGTLVSEVMLQQTQIKTVIPYYKRWMKEFPTLKSLAKSPIDRVLKLWEGLGYYSRARNLHKTAQILIAEFGGKIPQDIETLMSLPGIGRYTAGAIASIGFNISAPIVDGNVARVLSRIFKIKQDILKPATQKLLYELAEQLVSKKHPGDFNQALMELGSLVCFPAMPQCLECPIRSVCKAHKSNLQEELPIKENHLKRKKIHIASAFIHNNGSILIQKRDTKGIWGGLWEFPNLVSVRRTSLQDLKNSIEQTFGLKLNPISSANFSLVHKLTHMDTVIDCHSFETEHAHLVKNAQSRMWANPKQLATLSFPVPYQKVLKTKFPIMITANDRP